MMVVVVAELCAMPYGILIYSLFFAKGFHMRPQSAMPPVHEIICNRHRLLFHSF